MSLEDHAIVVGIASYPRLNPPPVTSADLQSPSTDADAVAEWLKEGGGLKEENVRVLRAGLPDSGEPSVRQATIRDEFRRLDDIAEKHRKQGIQKVGRRLYLYMSGHGFSPDRYLGALYTSDATSRDPLHCYASAWLKWFQDAAYFEEYVLWMDCCMDRIFTYVPEPIFPPRGGSNATGRAFVGLAAQRSLKTVERPIAEDSGKVHGIFTWTLLQGLKGEAADPVTGQITGRSLGDYLINTMKVHLTTADLANPQIAKEPEVPFTDPKMIFAQNVVVKKCQVTFTFDPLLAAKKFQVWGGFPPSPQKLTTDAEGRAQVCLQLGLFVVEMASAGLRQSFEILSKDDLEINVHEKGPVVAVPAAVDAEFSLAVRPDNEAAKIFVIDHMLRLDKDKEVTGQLHLNLSWGLYKVKLRIGSDTREHIFLLDRHVNITAPMVDGGHAPQSNLEHGQLSMERPRLVSAAPMWGNAFTHEYHIMAAMNLGGLGATRPLALFGTAQRPATAEIRLLARVWSSHDRGGSIAQTPWAGVELRREDGVTLLKLADLQVEFPENDPFVNARVEVQPGNYFLWQKLNDGLIYEQSLVVPKNWTLEVFLLSVPEDDLPTLTGHTSRSIAPHSRCSVLMKPGPSTEWPGPPEIPDLDRVLESSRVALADQRSVMNTDLEMLLMRKAENPLAALVGAHLIIAEAERSDDPVVNERLMWLDEVVPNLRSLLGSHHPDVEAISLRCPDASLRAKLPIQGVPMFERSWRLLSEGMQKQPNLVPTALWDRVRAAMSLDGFLIWAADDETRLAHMNGLVNWVRESESFANSVPESTGNPQLAEATEVRRSGLGGRGGLAAASRLPLSKDLGMDTVNTWAGKLGIPAAAMEDLIKKVQNKKQ